MAFIPSQELKDALAAVKFTRAAGTAEGSEEEDENQAA